MRHSFNLKYLLNKFDQEVKIFKKSIIRITKTKPNSSRPDFLLGPLPVQPFLEHSIIFNISYLNSESNVSRNEFITINVHSYDTQTKNSFILKQIKIGLDHHADNISAKFHTYSTSDLIYLTLVSSESSYQVNYLYLDCAYKIPQASQSFQYNFDFPLTNQYYVEIVPEKILQSNENELQILIRNIERLGPKALFFYFLPHYQENIEVLSINEPSITPPVVSSSTSSVTEYLTKIETVYKKYRECQTNLDTLENRKSSILLKLDSNNKQSEIKSEINKKELYGILEEKLLEKLGHIKTYQNLDISDLPMDNQRRIDYVLETYRQRLSEEISKLKQYNQIQTSFPQSQSRSDLSKSLDEILVEIRTKKKELQDFQFSLHSALIQIFHHLMEISTSFC